MRNVFFLLSLSALISFTACNKDEEIVNPDPNPSTFSVVVNEVMTKVINNGIIYVDGQGDAADWAEFYNPGTTAVNLAGYYVTDKGESAANEDLWQIPSGHDAVTTIPAGGKLIIIFGAVDGAGVDYDGIVNDTIFCPSGLSTSKDLAVGLYDSGKTFKTASALFNVDGPLGVLPDDKSLGRATDGAATWVIFDTPTPNAAN
jgi:hypothetical protein